ncbi:OprD family outer membrane porin [Pseudomonas sp. NPDC007930]|uniref:OprD family porin n=1 Tax=Pseudomonas sp. NPDC007930 TaxID=3364417 RepID=UPI0036E0EF17
MLKFRLGLTALSVLAAGQAMASDQSDAKGFVEDSHLDLLLRNAYISRDYQHKQDKAEWGQGFISHFSSGFTQGTVGVGVDAFGLYALRLDGGKGRSGAPGIDFFKQGDSGNAAGDIARAGAAVKFRVSNTVLKYGDMMPTLPVLNHDDSRLLPESFTGTMITSKEIAGLELNAGHFTREARKSAENPDSGDLKQIDVLGGSYKFTDNLSASLYASDVQDRLKKQYLGATYVLPLQNSQSLTFDFNGYRTHLDQSYADQLGTGQDNKIWSLAATYAFGAHSFTLAHQRSSGSTGYQYGWYRNAGGVGDGGSTIFLANSYWSDFNAEDERSWQLAYGLDFTQYGVPGLTYRVAYVRGDNIRTNDGEGTEREIFNQLQYVVQSGPAKDLKLRLRGSWLRVSNNASDYNTDGNEVRAFVEYPISIF